MRKTTGVDHLTVLAEHATSCLVWHFHLTIYSISGHRRSYTVADPGFPVGGGVDLVGGGVDSQGSYVSKILYVKMKELGPLGGARAGHTPLDPPMLHVNK